MDVSFGMPLSPPKIIDGVTLKFPAKLWRMVNNCKTGSIAWDSSGISIRIQRKQFEHEYLSSSKYFKTTNFPSFVRQLNIYGFRKIPTSSRWQDSGTVFEYRHDYFIQGHPELLPEVRRNTAVRRTLRDTTMADTETFVAHNSIKFPVVSKSKEWATPKQQRKKVDDSHPLLKTKSTTILKYSVPQEDGSASKITTVYMNPRVTPVSDMQTMSPTRLHEQVVDLLPAMNTSDDEDGPLMSRKSSSVHVTKPFDSLGSRAKDCTMNKLVRNPILFLPSNSPDESFNMDNINIGSLSQESMDSSAGKQLMFSCPVDRDDIDEPFNLPCEDDEMVGDESKTTGLSKPYSTGESCLDTNCTVFDMMSQQMLMSDSLNQLGDEQGYLTPAYFNPETGIVTLLLPNLSPEA